MDGKPSYTIPTMSKVLATAGQKMVVPNSLGKAGINALGVALNTTRVRGTKHKVTNQYK